MLVWGLIVVVLGVCFLGILSVAWALGYTAKQADEASADAFLALPPKRVPSSAERR